MDALDAVTFPPPAPADDTPLARWRTRLQPFLDALQFKLRVDVAPLPSEGELHNLWVSVNYFSTETFHVTTWAQTLEALELLDLLVHVDAQVGWTLLLDIADADRVFRINEAALFDYGGVNPQFAFELESAEMLPYLVRASEAVCAMVDLDAAPDRSPLFLTTQRVLLDAWSASHGGQVFNRASQGRIRIKPRFRVEGTNMLVRAARDLETLAAGVERARTRWASMDDDERGVIVNPFVVDTLELQLSGSSHPSDEIVESLINVTRRNLTIANLVVEPLLFNSDCVDVLLFKLLRPPIGQVALARLELLSTEWTEDNIYTLCSTLAHSRGLTEFVVGSADAIYWLWAPWLAYALFRADTTHDIRSVTLPMKGFATRHVESMLHVLEHTDPLAFLKSGGVHESDNPHRVEWNRHGSRVTHLKLDYVDPASRGAVLELLHLVGPSLEGLTLKQYGVAGFSREFMDAVMVRCPNLRRLEIAEAGVTLDWLYTPPPDDRPRAMPTTLILEGRMENPTGIEFFRALEDNDHALSKTLKEFHFSMWRSRSPPFEMFDAWLAMLDSNRQLARSEVVMSEKGVSMYKLAKYRERFEAHNGDQLEDQLRLAFLSAMSPRKKLIEASLSADTLKLVMDFAWVSKKRICG